MGPGQIQQLAPARGEAFSCCQEQACLLPAQQLQKQSQGAPSHLELFSFTSGLKAAAGEFGGKSLTQVPRLVRSTEEERKDLISLAGVQRERSRGKRHFSSKDEKLCSDGGGLFVRVCVCCGGGEGSIPALQGQWYLGFATPAPRLRGQFLSRR